MTLYRHLGYVDFASFNRQSWNWLLFERYLGVDSGWLQIHVMYSLRIIGRNINPWIGYTLQRGITILQC